MTGGNNPFDKNRQSLKAKINYHETMSVGGNKSRKPNQKAKADEKGNKGTKSVRAD